MYKYLVMGEVREKPGLEWQWPVRVFDSEAAANDFITKLKAAYKEWDEVEISDPSFKEKSARLNELDPELDFISSPIYTARPVLYGN